ncbi:MAG: hypothetical protein LUD14_03785 [Clostridiales bacterium]|nr:hypothetical protein [Clostridiales bacterium]
MNKYLKKIFGKNWKIDAYKSLPIENRFRVISDSKLPYMEYMDFIENQQPTFKFIKGYRAYYNQWKEYKYSPIELKVTNTFKQAKMSVDRIDVWYRLKDRREDLKKLYKVQDISSLKIILKEYLQKTEKYKSDKIGFYIDDEIWNYAKLIWESEGKKNYAETVYSYIPDLYKIESVEDYLQAKGILESMK